MEALHTVSKSQSLSPGMNGLAAQSGVTVEIRVSIWQALPVDGTDFWFLIA
jgi:hypothetical protein